MNAPINTAAVAALADEPVDVHSKGLPISWSGRTPAQICATTPNLFAAGPVGPVCALRGDALAHNLSTMAAWCARRGVELAPHGKTHMSVQLFAKQLDAGACALTAATISQVRSYRAFGVRDFVLANELVDRTGLRWLANELDADPDFTLVCWVDSVQGVDLMTAELAAAGARRPVDVCVEIGVTGGRTGCRDQATIAEVACAAARSSQLRLIGVAGYEAVLGHDVSPAGVTRVTEYLTQLRSAVLRLAGLFECDDILVTAGGSTYFDLVADILADSWPDGLSTRVVLRSGCYLTHDDGLYQRTSPLTRPDAGVDRLRPALSVWAQVCSRPEPELALLTMGRRDVSFDQDLPVPQFIHTENGWSTAGLDRCQVVQLNDQHAFMRLGPDARVDVGSWLQFGISHPCTVFDKWRLIPILDEHDRVVEIIRTFF
ncbi:MAG: alanine racemase [Mycobacterium sp.]|nr:alanine racemase [Mycobacterium sp.]